MYAFVRICVCVFVLANISSAEIDVRRGNWAERITAGARTLRSGRRALGRTQVYCVHWTQGARQTAVARDWLRSGTAVPPRAKSKDHIFHSVLDVAVSILVMGKNPNPARTNQTRTQVLPRTEHWTRTRK